MTRAEEKALGLFTDNSSTIDGWIGFSNTALFNYDPNNRAATGKYDFVGTVEHEISEVMGRISGLSFGGYAPIDLFRYAAPGTPQLGTGSPSYFSLDHGTTNLNSWNNFTTGDSGDLADWAPSVGPDSFLDVAIPGVTNSVTPTDILLMQSIGWTTSPTINVTNVTVAENSTIPASSLITSVSLPKGDLLDGYAFLDGGNGNGHFVVNGTVQPDGQAIVVSDLSSIQYVGGSSPGSETLYVEVHDATTQTWSNTSSLTATTIAATVEVTTIQNEYLAITRTALPLDQATTIANSINAGTTTESQFVNSLFPGIFNTTIPAVAVEASMYGATGTSAEVTALTILFLPGQEANATKYGLNPLVYGCEVLGLVFAFANENGSTAFANNFGPSNNAMPNSTVGDAAFAAAASNTIFGSASTVNLVNVLEGFISNWKAFYTANGVAVGGVSHATADQVDLAARGAAWGDMVGVALANNLGPLFLQTVNFLDDAAQGTAVYGASLIGQPVHQQFPG
jgi:hypothetical protein